MKATIIIVGTELTRGRISDSHVSFISSSLFSIGIETEKAVIIPDKPDVIIRELSESCKSADIIFISGGLGPTSDDHTRDVLSAVSGKKLVFRTDLWDTLTERYPHLGSSMSNKKQAMLPEGFTPIDNTNGTAPGIYGRIGNAIVFALPGPPGELIPMYNNHVLPMLRGLTSDRIYPSHEKMYTCFLIPESRLEDALLDLGIPGLSWATQAQTGRVLLILTASSKKPVEDAVVYLRKKFLSYFILEGNVNIYELLLNELKKQSLLIAAAESCTGGAFSYGLTSVPGASSALWGAFVVYSNEAKRKILGVSEDIFYSYGAVSSQCVSAMLKGLFSISTASVGIAISGIAGPSGGSEEKPVGTVYIAVGRRESEELVVKLSLRGSREKIMHRAALVAAVLAYTIIRYPDLDMGGVKEYIENKLV
ncbi:nicotinamide-nucleotide amidohydrolase family protein [Spirochaetia bacterium 38H-sp]|uniref:CinA-like protein n=1 Tax=Rarispira pelagica TaxID=3141764 RepID=A0ABU9UCA4_9SPIR